MKNYKESNLFVCGFHDLEDSDKEKIHMEFVKLLDRNIALKHECAELRKDKENLATDNVRLRFARDDLENKLKMAGEESIKHEP